MAVERLTGPDDPRVADYRDFAEHELVRSRGLFIAEGRLVVRRLIEDRRHTLRSVLVSEAAHRALEATLAAVHAPVYICEASDFTGITGHDLHRGCLALVERPAALDLHAILEPLGPMATLIVLEGVANADNVGGVFRNAAAFGADGVLLDPTCCDPLYRKAIRTSMGAVLRMPFSRVDAWPYDLAELRDAGFEIAALTPREPAVSIEAFAGSRPSRVALLVGSEGAGLTKGAETAADCRVRIPIAPEVDSLNLAVAVGIALHRLTARETA
jgi:tRNA G18 (ribose-2'-O)-methylase SpoU